MKHTTQMCKKGGLMAVINFEIFKVIGTLSEDKEGKKKQLTCTSWGKYNPSLTFGLGIVNIQA